MSNMQDFVALTSVPKNRTAERVAVCLHKQCCASVIHHKNAIAKNVMAYQYLMWPEYLEQNAKSHCGVTLCIRVQTHFLGSPFYGLFAVLLAAGWVDVGENFLYKRKV